MSIGSKLSNRGLHADGLVFLLAGVEIYPDAKYAYYTHYLAAAALKELSRPDTAADHCREALRLNPDFAPASLLLEDLTGELTD